MDISSQIFKRQLPLLSLHSHFKILRQGIQLPQTHSNTPSTFIVLGTYSKCQLGHLNWHYFGFQIKEEVIRKFPPDF